MAGALVMPMAPVEVSVVLSAATRPRSLRMMRLSRLYIAGGSLSPAHAAPLALYCFVVLCDMEEMLVRIPAHGGGLVEA